MAHPNLILNYPAMLVALFAAFFFGFIWYGPLFGKKWAGLMGMKMDQKPDSKKMMQSMILQVIGLALLTFVLAHNCQVWRPSVWGVGQDSPDYVYGFFCGLFTWAGFYVPMQFGKISWECRPWKLFFLNTTYDFLNLQLISQILAHWR